MNTIEWWVIVGEDEGGDDAIVGMRNVEGSIIAFVSEADACVFRDAGYPNCDVVKLSSITPLEADDCGTCGRAVQPGDQCPSCDATHAPVGTRVRGRSVKKCVGYVVAPGKVWGSGPIFPAWAYDVDRPATGHYPEGVEVRRKSDGREGWIVWHAVNGDTIPCVCFLGEADPVPLSQCCVEAV